MSASTPKRPGTEADRALESVIADAAGNDPSRGLILDLHRVIDESGHERLTIDVGRRGPKPADFTPPADYRAHTVLDVASMIDLLQADGEPENTRVFVSPSSIAAVLHDRVKDGEREILRCALASSAEASMLQAALNQPLTHETLVRTLEAVEHVLQNPMLLDAARKFSSTTTVDGSSKIDDAETFVRVGVTSAQGPQMLDFPKQVQARLPVFEMDRPDRPAWREMTMKVRVHLPKKADDGVRFVLSCPDWSMTVSEAVTSKINELRAGLPGWMVVRGEPKYLDRSYLPDDFND